MLKKIKEKKQLEILCIEDEPKDVNLIKQSLTEFGYDTHISHVTNRDQFLSSLKKNSYDIIFSDYKLAFLMHHPLSK